MITPSYSIIFPFSYSFFFWSILESVSDHWLAVTVSSRVPFWIIVHLDIQEHYCITMGMGNISHLE